LTFGQNIHVAELFHKVGLSVNYNIRLLISISF